MRTQRSPSSTWPLLPLLGLGLLAVGSAFIPNQQAFTPTAPGASTTNKRQAQGSEAVRRFFTSPWSSSSTSSTKLSQQTTTSRRRATPTPTMMAGKVAPKIIIAGAPASGKGTQCEMLKELYGVVHLSTGDILRAAVKEGTELGKLAKDYMDKGLLVPDDVIIGVVKDRLSQPDCQKQGWLLDGFPRTRAQAEALSKLGVEPDCFILLNVPDELLVERVVGRRTDPDTGKIYHLKYCPPPADVPLDRLIHRSDDTEDKIKVRVKAFHDNCAAVVGCYKDVLIEVDGTKPKDQVLKAITSTLDRATKDDTKSGSGKSSSALGASSHSATSSRLSAGRKLTGLVNNWLTLGLRRVGVTSSSW